MTLPRRAGAAGLASLLLGASCPPREPSSDLTRLVGTSDVLFAGRFTLRATTEGGRTASAPVTLVGGETTSVELSLDE